jgi:exopolysaccharide biosynthesis polyprenyl glycosylphosphotransferase
MPAPELTNAAPAAADPVAGPAAPPAPLAPPSSLALRRFFLPYSRVQRAGLALADVLLLGLVGAIAVLLLEPFTTDVALAGRSAAFALVGMIGLYAADCYDARGMMGPRELVARVLVGILLAAPADALVVLVVPALGVTGKTLALACLLAAATLVPVRIAGDVLLRRVGLVGDRIVLLGAGPAAVECSARLAGLEGDAAVVGWVGPRGAGIRELPRLGSYRALGPLAKKRGITRVVVDAQALGKEAGAALVAVREAGLPWVEANELLERLTGKLDLSRLDPRLIVYATGLEAGVPEAVAFHRIFEVVVAGVVLVLLAPLLAATAIAVRLESPGPALFLQERTGRGGRPFTIYKFRTMRNDAEAAGPTWAKKDDPRVTRLGRILRKTRIDELPQFLNVLMGDMSFVGPRPERPYFVEKIASVEPAYRLRHVVRPGVTGWAQVKYRYGATVEDAVEKLRYDLYYVFRWSPLLDLEVVLETVKVMLRGSNDH